MPIIIEDLQYVYMKGTPFEKVALSNINIKIDDGEFVGIIGHTGSGKSTLIQHFNGLLKPTSGKITVNDMDVSGSNLKELRKHVGIVFQYPEHQLFEESVLKDIAFGLLKQGLGSEEIESRVKQALVAVGLDESMLQKSPFELSGGQKRRVAIAGVIVMEPRVLVMDEPTAGLDPRGRDEILHLIAELHRQKGITVILVTHSMEEISRYAKRIIVMNKGTVEMDGEPREVFAHAEQLEEIGLSAPQITVFMRKLKAIYPSVNDQILTVAEARQEMKKLFGGMHR